MSSNIDLEKMANLYGLILNPIVFKNEWIPQYGCTIVNMADSMMAEGTHWIATYLDVFTHNLYYFDSFGAPMPDTMKKNLQKYKNIKRIKFNNWQCQDLNSSLCGYFCLFFLVYMSSKNLDKDNDLTTIYNTFINMFSENTKQNGKILKFLIERTIPKTNHNYKVLLNKLNKID